MPFGRLLIPSARAGRDSLALESIVISRSTLSFTQQCPCRVCFEGFVTSRIILTTCMAFGPSPLLPSTVSLHQQQQQGR